MPDAQQMTEKKLPLNFSDGETAPNAEDISQALQKDTPGAFARNVGGWIDNHKKVTSNNPVGYTTYQYVRSAVASVPYGFSMAGTWLGFQKLHELGAGMAGVDKARIASGEALVTDAVKGFKGTFGYRMSQFTAHPATRTAAMVGTSFSLNWTSR